MQKVEGICKQCGGDGERQQVGITHQMIYRPPSVCTHCKGSGMEPVRVRLRVGKDIIRILQNQGSR